MPTSNIDVTEREQQNELTLLLKLQERLGSPERGLQGSLEPAELEGFNTPVKVYVSIYESHDSAQNKLLSAKFVTHHYHDKEKIDPARLETYGDKENKDPYYRIPDEAKASQDDINEVHQTLRRINDIIQNFIPGENRQKFVGSANPSWISGLRVEDWKKREDYGSSCHHARITFLESALETVKEAVSTRITELTGDMPLVGENAESLTRRNTVSI